MAKRAAILEETHGALVFRAPQNQRSTTQFICRWEGHPPEKSGSGRWKVELLGYPLLDREGSPLRVCNRCHLEILDIYRTALANGVGEKVAA